MKTLTTPFQQNDAKFCELILFISERSEGDATFGATKLNKLLFYADFLAYLKFGHPITGHRYQKLDHGPAPRALKPILEKLKASGDVAIAEREYFGKIQKRTVALREPKLDQFTGEEVALVTQIIDSFWKTSATAISELSHQFAGWQVAAIGEDIPYEVAFISKAEPTDAVKDRGGELESLARECLARSNG